VTAAADHDWDALQSEVARAWSVRDAAGSLTRGLAEFLGQPVALLSRDTEWWHFEAEGFPRSAPGEQVLTLPSFTRNAGLRSEQGRPWTGLLVGRVLEREWLLMVPGASSEWTQSASVEPLLKGIVRTLEQVSARDDQRFTNRLARTLFKLSKRLERAEDPERLYQVALGAFGRQAGARTAALAIYRDADQALSIVGTIGYPASVVEQVRIAPGEGIIGQVFSSGRAMLSDSAASETTSRRLRYHTKSFMVLPIGTGRQPLAVVALTDRADGRAFDSRDFSAARMLAATAALALSRNRLAMRVEDLTRIATMDAVTGLVNRGYFEERLRAEVERARRHGHELALLMIDIDNFKRINDTWGHVEGDRALRHVADLLRAGVRIFDVCARFGGEEFVIVMPGATSAVASQVAERIRRDVETRSARDERTITISVGIGMLAHSMEVEDLVTSADRALIAAKAAGKNVVARDQA
jgi:diguanylate cyclase (GGDEF)-like protein